MDPAVRKEEEMGVLMEAFRGELYQAAIQFLKDGREAPYVQTTNELHERREVLSNAIKSRYLGV